MAFLESNVVPICTYDINELGKANIHGLVGTAFFINNEGHFLTAKHVIDEAIAEAEARSIKFGLVTKGVDGTVPENMMAPIQDFDFAPDPFDIAAGRADYHPKTTLKVKRERVSMWQEIASFGYPETASYREGNALWMDLRGYRGYVHRHTQPADRVGGKHPSGYELSFLLGPCSSGCPIFSIPDENLIGIGVGNFRSERIVDQYTEVDDNGDEYREVRVGVEQFGFAHDIFELLEWKPSPLEGKTLEEAICPS
ncbi:trypsin-like peptidase domain-containing protein [uncultured Roseibium sp.]|uniref:trypsin-like peptidase domain-containing protein n=1 Tax=uncultured Roseibium sp. TaxID=1936171 RepID=UPI0026145765|nr:trypsin-like peptidase domain-containing protein [uncultured Roseibium sp.]